MSEPGLHSVLGDPEEKLSRGNTSMSDRYSRQILFDGIGAAGQAKLGHSRVTVVGCGALGSVSAEILARAGIGHLEIIDRDFVEFSNLQWRLDIAGKQNHCCSACLAQQSSCLVVKRGPWDATEKKPSSGPADVFTCCGHENTGFLCLISPPFAHHGQLCGVRGRQVG